VGLWGVLGAITSLGWQLLKKNPAIEVVNPPVQAHLRSNPGVFGRRIALSNVRSYSNFFDAIDMVFTCKDCGIKFLSSSEFELHKQTHSQTHLDKCSSKPDKINWKAPDGLNAALYKVFEKYRLDDRARSCLWYNGQLNTAIREPSWILELQDRLKEWLQEFR
jgi:hypothetical protein